MNDGNEGMGAIWEPWTPKVGQDVIINLGGECPLPRHKPSPGRYVEHYPEQHGLRGTVIARVDWRNHEPGHDYLVSLPHIIHESGVGYCAGTFAACELEPIESSEDETKSPY